jgi:hypothetical protein
MKVITNRRHLLIVALLITTQWCFAQNADKNYLSNTKINNMKTYVIEREIPGAGQLTQEQLKDISLKSCNVIKEIGPSIKWIRSYVTNDKIYCVYQSENEELIRKHAKLGGFPCNSVQEIANVISPATAEAKPHSKPVVISY